MCTSSTPSTTNLTDSWMLPGHPATSGLSSYTPSYSYGGLSDSWSLPGYQGGGSSTPSYTPTFSPTPVTNQEPALATKKTPFSGFGDFAKVIGQAGIPLAMASYLGGKSQHDMLTGLSNAQQESYDKTAEAQKESYTNYLDALNPPEEVKQTQFNQLKNQVVESAPLLTQRISNQLAARGIRGEGLITPIAENERDTQKQINDAYFRIFGNYNVPGVMQPVSEYPVNYVPSTSSLVGSNVADLSTLLAMMDLYG